MKRFTYASAFAVRGIILGILCPLAAIAISAFVYFQVDDTLTLRKKQRSDMEHAKLNAAEFHRQSITLADYGRILEATYGDKLRPSIVQFWKDSAAVDPTTPDVFVNYQGAKAEGVSGFPPGLVDEVLNLTLTTRYDAGLKAIMRFEKSFPSLVLISFIVDGYAPANGNHLTGIKIRATYAHLTTGAKKTPEVEGILNQSQK